MGNLASIPDNIKLQVVPIEFINFFNNSAKTIYEYGTDIGVLFNNITAIFLNLFIQTLEISFVLLILMVTLLYLYLSNNETKTLEIMSNQHPPFLNKIVEQTGKTTENITKDLVDKTGNLIKSGTLGLLSPD